MYEVAPISAVRWAGSVTSINPYEDTGKLRIYCSKIFKVGPIKLDIKKYTLFGSRYTKFELVKDAKKLSDIF